jgi:hypothetical protein
MIRFDHRVLVLLNVAASFAASVPMELPSERGAGGVNRRCNAGLKRIYLFRHEGRSASGHSSRESFPKVVPGDGDGDRTSSGNANREAKGRSGVVGFQNAVASRFTN